MLSDKTILQQNPEIPGTEIDGEIVLMSCETGNYFSVAGTAASIWRALATETTLGAVCESLTAEYDVDPETCRRDVTEFVTTLAGYNLVRTAGA